MGRGSRAYGFLAGALLAAAPSTGFADGIAAHVTKVDGKARCVSLEWDNDTERRACWTDATKITVLDTGKSATAADIRKGSYLRLEGDEKDGAFRATAIEIWIEASRPE